MADDPHYLCFISVVAEVLALRQMGTTKKNWYTLCLRKKFPPLNCLWLCQILTDFQNFCTTRKRMKFDTKPRQHHPPHLRHVATLPWDIKNSNFLQIFRRYENNENKLHFQCTDCNSTTPVTVYAKCIYVFSEIMCFCQNLVLVAECHVDCWQTLLDVCCDEFPVPQTDRKVNK